MSDISKVVYGNEVLIDLTQDTVNANNMLLGTTAHGANGEPIVGSLITHDVIDNLTSTSTEDALSANQGRVLKEMIDSIDGGNGGSVIRVTFEEECAGDTVTFAMSGMTTITKTVPSESPYMIEVATTELGILTVTDVTQSIIKTININTYSLYTLYIALAGFKQWLEAGGITTQYASLAEVLADEKTVRKLFTKQASVDYLVSWAQVDNASLTTIINDNYCAKWINLRDYALDTLYSNATIKTAMDTADKYFYGEWVERDGVWQPKGNVPIMTSNSAPYGKLSQHTVGTDPLYKAFDGNDSTYSWGGNNNAWEKIEFANPVCVKRMLLQSYSATATRIWNFVLQGSNDDNTWENLQSIEPQVTTDKQYFSINNNSYYKYYRMNYTNPSTVTTQYTNLQFYGRELKVSVPTMTGNTSPWGEAIALSIDSTNDKWKAFDGNDSTFWGVNDSDLGTSGQWIGYKFGSPVSVRKIKNKTVNDNLTLSFKVQYSDDGVMWSDTGTVVENQVQNGSEYINDVADSGAHLCWRSYCVSASATTRFKHATLQFYGLDYSEHEERHWIYDHGVEVEEVSLTSMATKENDQLLMYQNSAGSASAYVPSIDLTDYNLARCKVGNIMVAYNNEFGTLSVLNANVTPTQYTTRQGISTILQTSDMPNNLYHDISSFNSNYEIAVEYNGSSANNAKLSVTEWWLE